MRKPDTLRSSASKSKPQKRRRSSRSGSHRGASSVPTASYRVLGFVEQPLFLAVFGILGGVLALVFPPFWALVVIIVALALHRSGVLSDKGRTFKIIAYACLLATSGALCWWVSGLVKRNLSIPTSDEIAQAVSRRLQDGSAIESPEENHLKLSPERAEIQPPRNPLLSLFMGDHNEFTGARSRAWPSAIYISGHEITTVFFRVNYDQDSRSKFILVYVPKNSEMRVVLKAVAEGVPKYLTFDAETLIRDFKIKAQGESEPERFTSYPFSGRAYVYYEGDVSIEDLGSLTAFYKRRNISVEFLGSDYVDGVWSNVLLGRVDPLPEYSIKNGNIVPPITYSDVAR